MGRHIELGQFELPLPEDFDFVSLMIEGHNFNHPDEMLPKKPNELIEIYQQGLSVILKKNGQVLGHAALWPLLKNANGELQVAEFGSWIVNPNFRHRRINGLTVGEYTATTLLEEVNIGTIATVKRANSFQGLRKIGFEPLDFYQFPFITSLTCVCSGKAEHLTKNVCSDRRRINYGLRPNNVVDLDFSLNSTSINEPPKIPCTLMGYNMERLWVIEKELQENLGISLDPRDPSFFVHFLEQAQRILAEQNYYQLV